MWFFLLLSLAAATQYEAAATQYQTEATQYQVATTQYQVDVYNIDGDFHYIGNPGFKELHFAYDRPEILSGDVIEVEVEGTHEEHVYVRDFIKLENDFPSRTTTLNTIVAILKVGDQAPSIDYTEFSDLWYKNMTDYVKNCTWNKVKFGENLVLDFTDRPMPATGTSAYSKLIYDTTKQCGFLEMYAFQEWAQKIYEETYGPISKFQRRIVLLPENNCPWYGTGSQGCQGEYCYVWVRGDRSRFLNTFFHEIGHTMNLQHSSTSSWEYGDCSCAMGCASLYGCYNAPAAIRGGWAALAANVTNVKQNRWYNYTIHPMQFSHKNTVRFDVTWTNETTARFYLSWKKKIGYDFAIAEDLTDRLLVHFSQADSETDYYRSYLVANLKEGESYVDAVRAVTVRFNSIDKAKTRMKVSFKWSV